MEDTVETANLRLIPSCIPMKNEALEKLFRRVVRTGAGTVSRNGRDFMFK
jgi:hypothetical protein